MPRNKYRAKKTFIDGILFDSGMEARRYTQLKLLERTGHLRDLAIHPKWKIRLNDKPICIVELDFEYVDGAGETHREDVKGVDTALSRLKRKLVEAQEGFTVEVVKRC